MGLNPNRHLVFSLNLIVLFASVQWKCLGGGAERLAGNWDYGAIFVPVIY